MKAFKHLCTIKKKKKFFLQFVSFHTKERNVHTVAITPLMLLHLSTTPETFTYFITQYIDDGAAKNEEN